MLREREARIRRASKRLKSQLAGVEDERRRLAQDRTKMAHASTTSVACLRPAYAAPHCHPRAAACEPSESASASR